MRMETDHSRAHNIGYMGICHGDDPDVTCKRCGILCCYDEEMGVRCWEQKFGDGRNITNMACSEED